MTKTLKLEVDKDTLARHVAQSVFGKLNQTIPALETDIKSLKIQLEEKETELARQKEVLEAAYKLIKKVAVE